MKRAFKNTKQGIATLPAVMVLGVMALAIAVGLAVVSFSESLTSQSSQRSLRAVLYAEAGARDALIKVARNKDYTTSPSYTIDFVTDGCSTGSGCATITVSGTNPKTITSVGQANAGSRSIQVIATLDASGYGQIISTTWTEL